MKQGKREKKALMGVEVYGKTMGVIGIGNIGIIVGREKALALGMKVLAYDIFISKEFTASKGIESGSDTLLKESDFITVHVPLVKETRGPINKDAIAKMKKSVIIINVARGPVVNDGDSMGSPQVELPVLHWTYSMRNHLRKIILWCCATMLFCTSFGASTAEAQDKVAIDIANQIVDFFRMVSLRTALRTISSFDVAKKIALYLKAC